MGLSYRKGQGLKENMVSADELMEKKRGWSWTDSAGLASFLLQMSTSDLSDLDNLKRQKDELDRLFNRNNNYPIVVNINISNNISFFIIFLLSYFIIFYT